MSKSNPMGRPKFAIGDRVREKFPRAADIRDRGMVVESYELDNEYRYVVKFDIGREGVFFERELIADHTPRD